MSLKPPAILLILYALGALWLPSDAQAVEIRVGGIHPGLVGHPGFTVNRNVGMRPARVGPGHRWWRPGGAIAAGVAIGFLSATMASDWAGPPPASGYCWYYTDITHWYGFWDQCP